MVTEISPRKVSLDILRSNVYSALSLYFGDGSLDLGVQGGFRYRDLSYSHIPIGVSWCIEDSMDQCVQFANRFPYSNVVCDNIANLLLDCAMIPSSDILLARLDYDFQRPTLARTRSLYYRNGWHLGLIGTLAANYPKVFAVVHSPDLLLDSMEVGLRCVLSDLQLLGYRIGLQAVSMDQFGGNKSARRVAIIGIHNTIVDSLPNRLMAALRLQSPLPAESPWLYPISPQYLGSSSTCLTNNNIPNSPHTLPLLFGWSIGMSLSCILSTAGIVPEFTIAAPSSTTADFLS